MAANEPERSTPRIPRPTKSATLREAGINSSRRILKRLVIRREHERSMDCSSCDRADWLREQHRYARDVEQCGMEHGCDRGSARASAKNDGGFRIRRPG